MAQYDEFGNPIDVSWESTLPGGENYVPRGEDAWRPEDVTPEAAAGTGWVAPAPVEPIDYTGATYAGSYVPMGQDGVSESAVVNTFKYADGSAFDVNQRGEIVRYQPGYSTYEDPANIRAGYRNIPYAFSSLRGGDDGSGFTTFQGREVPVSAEEYVIDPDTGKVVLDERGQPIIQGTLNPSMRGENWQSSTAALTLAAMAGMGGLGGLGEAGAATTGAAEGLGLMSNPIIKAALTNAGYGAVTGGATAALTGQDALKGALIGGASGALLGGGEAAFFPGASEWAAGSVSNAGLLGAGRGAAGGALNTLLGGGDLKQNVLYGAGLGGALGAGSEYFFPSAQTSFANKEGEAPRWASVKDTLENAQQVLDKYTPNQLKLSMTDADYSGFGIDPRVRTGGGYDILDPEYITNRGGYGQGGYSGIGIDPEVEQLWGGQGLNPNVEYYTRGLANNAEALSQTSGINVSRNEFDARGGLTAEQEAALDRALTAADYAVPSSWFSGLGNLGTLLGAKALGGLGGGGAAAGRGAAGGGSFVPKGMVDYSGILNLLAPKTSTRTSLLG
jgi:hypothetical protein